MVGTTPYTVEVRETYTYGGLSGRPSRRDTALWVNGSAAESFTQSFPGYDALGNPTSVSYPVCTHTACTATTARTVDMTYVQVIADAATALENPLLQSIIDTIVEHRAAFPDIGLGSPARVVSGNTSNGSTYYWLQ